MPEDTQKQKQDEVSLWMTRCYSLIQHLPESITCGEIQQWAEDAERELGEKFTQRLHEAIWPKDRVRAKRRDDEDSQ